MRKSVLFGSVVAVALVGAAAAVAGGPYDYGGDYGSGTDTTAASTSTSASGSTGSATSETYHYVATMAATQEVPKPTGVPAAAKGSFKVTVVEGGGKIMLSWKLAYSGLTGKVGAAHIHKGAKGKAGAVILALCGPCKNGMSGKAPITEAVNKAIETGGAYVNVHTTKNANGEIRGQITLAKKS